MARRSERSRAARGEGYCRKLPVASVSVTLPVLIILHPFLRFSFEVMLRTVILLMKLLFIVSFGLGGPKGGALSTLIKMMTITMI